MRMSAIVIIAIALAISGSGNAQAGLTQFVTNGSFTSTTHGTGQLGYNTNATGWTSTGYNFLFSPSTADTTGSSGQYGALKLWGPNNGSANGLTASPDGGNFVGNDGGSMVGPLSQTLTNLIAGDTYTVSFYYAGAQQYLYYGATTEQWAVSLGSETQYTPVLMNSSEGFTGWQAETLTFTADASSDVLSFLAIGTPNGLPPFVLLDGVTAYGMEAVPEPSTVVLMGLGMLGVVGFKLRRRAKAAV